MKLLCSICIPCFKRTEQVRNTLKSIYEDNSDVPLDEYEIVITDNDPEQEINSVVSEFSNKKNIFYYPTKCEGFLNSYYSLTYGRGELLKLHNSQNKIKKGMLAKIVNQVKDNIDEKPLIFYTNGFLNKKSVCSYTSFDQFMRNLSYWSSWSGGMSIWKTDFESIAGMNLNPLFPHTSLFLTQYSKKKYIIDDCKIYDVQRIYKRGGHNKFEAFSVHYPSLIEECYKENHISYECKECIFENLYKDFIPTLLFNKYIARIETYDASGFRKNCAKYFPKNAYLIAWFNVMKVPFRMLFRRLRR